jgi:hypothetical protein
MKPKTDDPREGKQTNLAEGERDVVEQSIQAHERRGDLKPSTSRQRNSTGNAAEPRNRKRG